MTRLINNLFRKCTSKPTIKTNLEQQFVYNTYDLISVHFDHTRFARWPKVKYFLASLEKGSIVCDLGCGNGKYLSLDHYYTIGLDNSLKLLEIVREKNKQLQIMAADTLKVPYRNQSCDAVLSIAVLHHLSTIQLRLKALLEIKRILRINGRALVYVWCAQQQIKHRQQLPDDYYKRFDFLNREQDIFVKWHLQSKFSNKKNEQIGKESQISIVKRYYHLFKKGELQQLVHSAQGLEITKSQYDKQNWCVQFKKIMH